MGFVYEDGIATDVADWFTRLEAFLIAAGWTVESGSGTQTVVFKSIGEGGGRTQLHIRFRQAARYVYTRVQDDVAGTHSTTEDAYGGILDAGGTGSGNFDYWMIADKDCVVVMFLTGGAYTGSYIGIVERFAVSVSDEEKAMVTCGLIYIGTAQCGRVLMKYDGTWDAWVKPAYMTKDVIKNPIDENYPLFGFYVSDNLANGHIGQLKHVSNPMETYAGLNAQDVIVTGFGGATSWWTIFGTGTARWAVHTGGALPVGAWEGGFSYTSGVATDITDLDGKFRAFLATLGWSEVAHPSPTWPIEYLLNSSGQLAGDDIWLHWLYNAGSSDWGGRAIDDSGMAHSTPYIFIGGALYAGDFPVNYFIAGDGDCFIHGVEVASLWNWAWYGMFTMYLPDPSAFSTPYKVGALHKSSRYGLRRYDGTWLVNLTEWADRYTNSSPNLLDGTSYIIWPHPLHQYKAAHGQPKYLHRLSGSPLAINDTVTIGGRRYMYLADNFAVRDQ